MSQGDDLHEKQWYMNYYSITISQNVKARFKQNRFTHKVYIFQANCTNHNSWNEPGYGWGRWLELKPAFKRLDRCESCRKEIKALKELE